MTTSSQRTPTPPLPVLLPAIVRPARSTIHSSTSNSTQPHALWIKTVMGEEGCRRIASSCSQSFSSLSVPGGGLISLSPSPLHQLRQGPPVKLPAPLLSPFQDSRLTFQPLSLLNQVRPLLAHMVALRTRHAPSPPIPFNPNDTSPDPLYRTRKRQTQSSARQLFSYAFVETRWSWGRKTREEIEEWE